MKFIFSVFMEELIAIAKVHGELDNLYELEPRQGNYEKII